MRISDWSSDVCSSDLDETAFLGHAGHMRRPIAQRLLPEGRHQRLRAFTLAPGREHAARIPGAAVFAEAVAAVENFDRGAAFGQFEGAGEARHPGADDGDRTEAGRVGKEGVRTG